MKRVNLELYASVHDIDFMARAYEDAPEGEVDVVFPEGILDEWDDQGRLVRLVMLPWEFHPDRLIEVARRHPDVFQDLRFDVEGLGENLTFEEMILRAYEKVKEDPEIAKLLPPRTGA